VRFYRDSGIGVERIRADINDQLQRLDRGAGTRLADAAAREAFLAEIEREVQGELARGAHLSNETAALSPFPTATASATAGRENGCSLGRW
jgi:hypothetical protein